MIWKFLTLSSLEGEKDQMEEEAMRLRGGSDLNLMAQANTREGAARAGSKCLQAL